jgi:hypothetical protein
MRTSQTSLPLPTMGAECLKFPERIIPKGALPQSPPGIPGRNARIGENHMLIALILKD